jgi:hypothetical protein
MQTFNLTNVTTSTGYANFWTDPIRVDVIENNDNIEFIYKETSLMQLAVYPQRPSEQRVFKIVFSCVDGKWNKSERIYGKIIPAESERYEF